MLNMICTSMLWTRVFMGNTLRDCFLTSSKHKRDKVEKMEKKAIEKECNDEWIKINQSQLTQSLTFLDLKSSTTEKIRK